uniref:Intein C-terminal splicing domain-containing protein n=1 Tax=Chromera velia CCMP2878 TaxID=1169474 RepID=A0A0G4HSV2_9ALVE|eukprot:Cvel_8311.t1-p1 / transcript=Cvel_8311.t1 / gene=Cvel_8311 / organism=Chromera_velia_CCMP2878 / gene_product=hypothetical protein / transcript_product=hypothetical protein / location=Cvel_scaffold456:44753-46757(-) / protein_length=204 / sequence_SO=supercontig / SO=protein_coding / is_pseudo=false
MPTYWFALFFLKACTASLRSRNWTSRGRHLKEVAEDSTREAISLPVWSISQNLFGHDIARWETVVVEAGREVRSVRYEYYTAFGVLFHNSSNHWELIRYPHAAVAVAAEQRLSDTGIELQPSFFPRKLAGSGNLRTRTFAEVLQCATASTMPSKSAPPPPSPAASLSAFQSPSPPTASAAGSLNAFQSLSLSAASTAAGSLSAS